MQNKTLCDPCKKAFLAPRNEQGGYIDICSDCSPQMAADFLSDKFNQPKYSISVYEDKAIIRGYIDTDVLKLLIRLCQKEGFTRLSGIDDGSPGFKLVREP